MRAHQLKNFLVVGLFVGILGSFLLFCTLVTSMSIYSGFSKTTSIIKSYGISKSTVYFGKFYVKLFKYNLDYGSQLDQPTRSKLKKPCIYHLLFLVSYSLSSPLYSAPRLVISGHSPRQRNCTVMPNGPPKDRP